MKRSSLGLRALVALLYMVNDKGHLSQHVLKPMEHVIEAIFGQNATGKILGDFAPFIGLEV